MISELDCLYFLGDAVEFLILSWRRCITMVTLADAMITELKKISSETSVTQAANRMPA